MLKVLFTFETQRLFKVARDGHETFIAYSRERINELRWNLSLRNNDVFAARTSAQNYQTENNETESS